MARTPEDKLVKILLNNGGAVHMYADPASIEDIHFDPRFIRFKDDGNDNIYISIESIAGFEVLDDRTDISIIGAVPPQDASIP